MVCLWEPASGQQRRRYAGHQRWVRCVDFDPDGRRLASGGLDGTALVWRVFEPASAQRSAAELDALWADLAKDGTTVHRAIAALIADKETPGFLKDRLKPARQPPEQQVQRLLADLGSPVFQTRNAAHKELARAGELIEPALRRALQTAPDLEMGRRLVALLESILRSELPPDQLRDLRAVEVLGQHANDEVRGALTNLAKGAAGSSLTRQARLSLANRQRER